MSLALPIRFASACRPIFMAVVLALTNIAQAQVAVTSVSYGSLVDASNSTHGGLSFRNQFTPVNTVTTGIGDFRFDGPVASAVNFRRNTASSSPNNSTVFYQTLSGDTSKPLGDFESTLGGVMLSNNLTMGLRNPFANGTDSTNSNIERIDFTMSNYVVQASDALVFFDLENTGNFGDGFRIAAFTATGTVNGFANAPTVYANAGILVAPDSFGGPINSPTDGTSGRFIRATHTAGDSLSGTPTTADLGTGLNLVGILLRFSDLGIAAGTTIQGFSLFAGDVAITSASALVDWTDTATYLTNTDPANSGNMDFMAFGARVSRPVPEPSTYGALLIGGMLLVLGVRRYRRGCQTAA